MYSIRFKSFITLNTIILVSLVIYFVVVYNDKSKSESFGFSNTIKAALEKAKTTTEIAAETAAKVQNSVQIAQDKPSTEEVITLFKDIKSQNKDLNGLNEMIKSKGYKNYKISLRAFVQMIKLNIKNELTPENITHFI